MIASAEETGVAEAAPKKHEEDYFSFFSSHEKVILRPESTFKNLRQFMEFLPIDYYILLQEGFENKKPGSVKSNHIFYTNLPLLVKKRSYIKQSTDIVKNITYEDIMRCLDKNEAEQLLHDSFAQDELVRHLTQKYGSIKEMFHINYKTQDILLRFVRHGRGVGTDEIQEFEDAIQRVIRNANDYAEDEMLDSVTAREKKLVEEASFEDLLDLANEGLQEDAKGAEAKGTEERNKKVSKAAAVVAEDLRRKERKVIGLDRQVNRAGFIVFKDRVSKLKMMNTPLFLFGMKLYHQIGHMEFFDADFCNTVLVRSDELVDRTLREANQIINEMLLKAGFEGELLKIGKLKDLGSDEFDLGRILVRKDYQISLRFNSFQDAL